MALEPRPSPERVRLVVLFGGRSAEHEVSCISALHVMRAIDPQRYEVAAVGITRDGRWVAAEGLGSLPPGALALPSPEETTGTSLSPGEVGGLGSGDLPVVVFPVLHGPMGEDGTVQGMLELAGLPYVGAGVLASALCMDKAMCKQLLAAGGLPVVRSVVLNRSEVEGTGAESAVGQLGYPVFVKPSNMGSSVGVSRVSGPGELEAAVALALRYDDWVLAEEAVQGREIEVAVIGNEAPRASVPGEIRPSREFYDFEDKYLDGSPDLVVPAPLDEGAVEEVRRLAVDAYRLLRVEGMARVDFFYEEHGRGFIVNELNTIPGFTPGSMYPMLWSASGLPYPALIDELVRLALERHRRRQEHRTER
ncbi:MAG TPA: D-alanine--D-alanine ligase family protein [Acidimicrobiales bacterium]|nr:D-alanine--D-alanine ligase family protein [Acidimicrobiales bacterium]